MAGLTARAHPAGEGGGRRNVVKRAVGIGFLLVVGGLLAAKPVASGWLDRQPPLPLGDQPALLFFNSDRGCPCALVVYQAADAQLASWPEPARQGVHLHRIMIERRPDLARQYRVARAPTLVLLDGAGQIVWRQDDVISDTAPLDLRTVEARIESLAPAGAERARQMTDAQPGSGRWPEVRNGRQGRMRHAG